jgi:hypothetical protein
MQLKVAIAINVAVWHCDAVADALTRYLPDQEQPTGFINQGRRVCHTATPPHRHIRRILTSGFGRAKRDYRVKIYYINIYYNRI